MEERQLATLVSQFIVAGLGAIIIFLAIWGMLTPGKFMLWVTSVMETQWGIYLAVLVRIILGVALISVAPVSLFPTVFKVLGWIAIFAAIVLAIAGRARLRRFALWWSEQISPAALRVWLLAGVAFGVFLVYGAL